MGNRYSLWPNITAWLWLYCIFFFFFSQSIKLKTMCDRMHHIERHVIQVLTHSILPLSVATRSDIGQRHLMAINTVDGKNMRGDL